MEISLNEVDAFSSVDHEQVEVNEVAVAHADGSGAKHRWSILYPPEIVPEVITPLILVVSVPSRVPSPWKLICPESANGPVVVSAPVLWIA